MVSAAVAAGMLNVQLLGGEPTLHKDLRSIIGGLVRRGRKVWLTTNGSRLSADYVQQVLAGVSGVNVSVHHYNLAANAVVTGINLDFETLRAAIERLHDLGATVRLNCTCIAGAVDSRSEMSRYIDRLAKPLGTDTVRFAELKGNTDSFVNLTRALGGGYGLTDDPFRYGCSLDATIDEMPVNLRIMCGLQTKYRPAPLSPEQVPNPVLYYDGVIYSGWQLRKEILMPPVNHVEATVTNLAIDAVIAKLTASKINTEEASRLLKDIAARAATSRPVERRYDSGPAPPVSNCQY